MSKNVCMFVWNHFTNDARVLRECTALSESGYTVDLVCIHDPKDEKLQRFEQRNERFKIYRVRRYPLLLEILQKTYKYSKQNKFFGCLCLLTWGLLIYLFPMLFLILSLLGILLVKTKLNVIWVRGSLILRMIRKGYQKHYDIFHSNDLNTLPQGYICSKWRFKPRKLVYDSHEVQTSRTGYNSSFYGKLESFLLKKIDSMIVENHTRAKYNEDLYGFYPNVIHNYPFMKIPINNEIFSIHELLKLPKSEKILLYQGGIQTGRGLDKLIQAVPLFNEGTLVLIGDGKIKKDLMRQVDELGLTDKVRFIPKVPLNDLPKYTTNAYMGFQVLNNVCFNHYSASSNKLFEYMMSGVPVIACSFPEIKRVVESEQIGICIDSHNYLEIAQAVNSLLANEQLRNFYSEQCLKARFNYNWEMEQHAFLDIYKKLS